MKLPGNAVGISDILQYLACPSRFEFGMRRHSDQPPPELDSASNAYGSAIHLGIHTLDTTGEIEQAIHAAFRAYKAWLDPDDLRLLREDLDLYLTREPVGYRMVMSETEIKVPLFVHPTEGQIYFRARIDKLYVREDNDAIYLHRDYKSSKWAKSEEEVHTDTQCWAYNWSLHEYMPEIEHLAQEYDQLRYGIIPTHKNEDQRARMKDWLIEVVNAIIADDVLAPTHNLFCPWCFPGETEVVTAAGIRRIDAIEPEALVLTHKGRYRMVKATASRPAKTVRRAKLSGGGEICGTPEHPILATRLVDIPVWNANRGVARSDGLPPGCVRVRGTGPGMWFDWQKAGKARDWVNLAELQPGDLVWGKVPSEKPALLDEDEQSILGWYLAEGDAAERSTSFSLHSHEIAFKDEIQSLLRKVFGAEHFEERIHGNSLQFYIHSHHIASWFRYFGGTHSQGKRIHPAVFSPERMLNVAVTAWKGDGTKSRSHNTQHSYTSSSRQLAYQLQMILMKNGIVTHFGVREAHMFPKPGGVGKRQTAYILVANGISAQKVAQLVGGNQKVATRSRPPSSIYRDGWVLQAIKSIDDEPYRGRVYDLEVAQDASFVLASNVAAHNCPIMMNCEEITSGLTDFALDRIAVLAPREPKLKADGTPGKRLEPPQLDPNRFSEYTEILPKVDQAKRALEVYSDTVKKTLKEMSSERVSEFGYSLREKKQRGLTPSGMRSVHGELGDDFYAIADLSRAAAERYYGKGSEELTIIDNYLEVQGGFTEVVKQRTSR